MRILKMLGENLVCSLIGTLLSYMLGLYMLPEMGSSKDIMAAFWLQLLRNFLIIFVAVTVGRLLWPALRRLMDKARYSTVRVLEKIRFLMFFAGGLLMICLIASNCFGLFGEEDVPDPPHGIISDIKLQVVFKGDLNGEIYEFNPDPVVDTYNNFYYPLARISETQESEKSWTYIYGIEQSRIDAKVLHVKGLTVRKYKNIDPVTMPVKRGKTKTADGENWFRISKISSDAGATQLELIITDDTWIPAKVEYLADSKVVSTPEVEFQEGNETAILTLPGSTEEGIHELRITSVLEKQPKDLLLVASEGKTIVINE